MIACAKGNADMVGALLKAGADIHPKAKNGDTALDKAIAGNHIPIVKALLKVSGGIDREEALFAAAGDGNLEIVQLLMTKSTDVNRRGFAGGSLLMLAAEGDFALVKFLVERGANVNHKDDEGKTALMKAVASFHSTRISSVKFLIDHGANPNAVNMRGETALILAAKGGQADMVQVLLEKGSSVAVKDKAGKSAWTYATEGGYSEVAALLEKAGAARDYQDTEWKGNISAQKEAFIKVVETPQEWSELWMHAFAKPAPAIDFGKVAVACVFLGHGADWLYSISFGKPFMRGNQMVVTYGLVEIQLQLSDPFKASGQYAMKVLEKKPGVPIILQDDSPASR
jgi:ankyrin repeat protein